MDRFPCPYLNGSVDLTAEREQHISERHPDLWPGHRDRVAETLRDPDQIRRSRRFGNAHLFSRWYTDEQQGKHVVVVVVSDFDQAVRHWMITAYLTRQISGGDVIWKRN